MYFVVIVFFSFVVGGDDNDIRLSEMKAVRMNCDVCLLNIVV